MPLERARPAVGHEGMTIGLLEIRDVRVPRVPRMLALPFLGRFGGLRRQPSARPAKQRMSLADLGGPAGPLRR